MKKDTSKQVEILSGAPPKHTQEKSLAKLIIIFVAVGLLFSCFLLSSEELLEGISGNVIGSNSYVMLQALLGLGMSVLLSSLQALVLSGKIRSRLWLFISSAGIGGLIGGLIVGVLVQSYIIVYSGYMAGFWHGLIAGGISSLMQNSTMSSARYNFQWFIFSVVAWAITFSFGWGIGWWKGVPGIASGLAFILISMSILLSLFLKFSPDIEFN